MILLGLLGPSASGRGRIAQHLVVAHNWAQYRMVGPVREMLDVGFGLDPAVFDKGPRYGNAGPLPTPATMEASLYAWGSTQWPDIWRAMAARQIHHLAELNRGRPDDAYPGVVISDLQGEEDADWVRKNGGTIWHTQSIIPEVDGKGTINTEVKYHLDDELMLLSNPGQDVGPLVDNVLPETLARYVAN